MANYTFEKTATMGVPRGELLTINSAGVKRYDEQLSWVDCLTSVRPVTESRPVDGCALRETTSEREANEDESLDILKKVRQGSAD